jgi:hypothetical protein
MSASDGEYPAVTGKLFIIDKKTGGKNSTPA